MMLLRIGTTEYDVTEALRKPTLNDLYYLKVKTRSEEHPTGVSLKTLQDTLDNMAEIDVDDWLDNAEMLLALRVMIYLARRHAGERVNLDQANDFALQDLALIAEDSDEPVLEENAQNAKQDPPQPLADSGPAGEPTAGGTAFPTTSKPTSTSGSELSSTSTPA